MREFIPFAIDEEIAEIGRALVDRTLPKARWTHGAHFAATLWLLESRGLDDVARELPGLIRAYNEATGVRNNEAGGYHETITQASLRAAAWFRAARPGMPLFAVCNSLMETPLGGSDWILDYWSHERLFSVEARSVWVEPDLRRLPF